MHNPMPPAAYTGTHGRAWPCNRAAALRAARVKAGADAVIADWIITTPAAHHLVHTCHLALLHLRPGPAGDDVRISVPGATHELWVMAMDPRAPREDLVHGTALPVHHYYAQVFAAQIVAADDADAIARMAATITLIVNGDLNPVDQPQWIELFGDAMVAPAHA